MAITVEFYNLFNVCLFGLNHHGNHLRPPGGRRLGLHLDIQLVSLDRWTADDHCLDPRRVHRFTHGNLGKMTWFKQRERHVCLHLSVYVLKHRESSSKREIDDQYTAEVPLILKYTAYTLLSHKAMLIYATWIHGKDGFVLPGTFTTSKEGFASIPQLVQSGQDL